MNKGRYRKNVVKLSLSDDEYKKFLEKVKITNLTNQAFLYKMVFDNYIAVIDFKEIAALRNEINKIGININQITRKVNETQKVEINELKYMSKILEECNKRVDDVVREILKE